MGPSQRPFIDGTDKSLHLARVVAYYAGFNYYDVVLAQGGAIRKAAPPGGAHGVAVRGLRTVPPGTIVIVADSALPGNTGPRQEYLEILGTVNGITTDQSLGLADSHDLLSGAGYLFDKIHRFLTAERANGTQPIPLGAGMPIDSLGGEVGEYGPLGPSWFVGLAMAYLRASDRCGVWMYRLDEHMRAVAKSLESQTMAREAHELYDDGELSTIERIAFVPWEALGAFENGVPVGIPSTLDLSGNSGPPAEFPIKTVEVDQRSIFRFLKFQGYLGDIRDEFVDLPVEGTGIDAYGKNADKHQGVFRCSTSADGTYFLQSAKGIHLEKYALIQLPLELKTPDDPKGDTPANYKASGTFGEGDTQKREDYRVPDDTFTGDRGILGLDFHGAYISKAALQTLRAHKKDWKVQDEKDTPLATKLQSGLYPGFLLDPTKQWMLAPASVELPIQQGRWGNTRYYAGRSAIDMWDDGSVVIEDAWGSQVIMAGGNITLTSPNDIILAPGRSLVALAPQDAVIRAGNSVDITATRKDIHLKAERNLALIGGNSGEGGVLVESRATVADFSYTQPGEKTDVRGLVLSSPQGTTAIIGKEVSVVAQETLGLQAAGTLGILADSAQVEVKTQFDVTAGDPSARASGRLEDSTTYRFTKGELALGMGATVEITGHGNLTLSGSLSALKSSFFGGGLGVAGGIRANSVSACW